MSVHFSVYVKGLMQPQRRQVRRRPHANCFPLRTSSPSRPGDRAAPAADTAVMQSAPARWRRLLPQLLPAPPLPARSAAHVFAQPLRLHSLLLLPVLLLLLFLFFLLLPLLLRSSAPCTLTVADTLAGCCCAGISRPRSGVLRHSSKCRFSGVLLAGKTRPHTGHDATTSVSDCVARTGHVVGGALCGSP